MSLVNKILASVGIGSTKVDARLEKLNYTPGEAMKGVVDIRGGKVEQHIELLKLFLCSRYKTDDSYRTVTLAEYVIAENMTITPEEHRTVGFNIVLPMHTPISTHHTPVWLETGAAISMAIDPRDKDDIKIQPTAMQAAVLNGLQQLGFQLKRSEYQHSPYHRHPVQEFEFYPSAEFRGRINELEVMFLGTPENLSVMFEVDKRAGGLAGLMGVEFEKKRTWNVNANMLPSLTGHLHQYLKSIV